MRHLVFWYDAQERKAIAEDLRRAAKDISYDATNIDRVLLDSPTGTAKYVYRVLECASVDMWLRSRGVDTSAPWGWYLRDMLNHLANELEVL